ncbi:aldehyde dehydrogenase [Caloranaerobacter sp. TR13]|nr:aldehyde dehydrogenase [Caloranaerobacter sp. TR13]KPU27667.1 aldehyde dehydrogenase [Caloranaerobacter sp. TR13]
MDEIKKLIDKQKEYFRKGITLDVSFRINKLKVLRRAIIENEGLILKALKEDLNKSDFEGYETEIGIVLDEIRYIMKNLKSWAKPKRVKTPITQFISKSYIYSEPYGIALIIAPWNYPFQLVMAPLIGSISAGNCSIIKPSEYAPNTSKVISKIISDNFEEEFIAVVEGGIEVNKALLKEKFDYIFFTGSVNVGKIVMEAASKHLTPVTLELGGKSPCIVDEDTDVDLAAKRIVWGKFLNAGQTCVAPDYLYLHKNIKNRFIKSAVNFIKEFFGENPLKSVDYTRIINITHFNRLKKFLKDGNILYGGDFDEEKLYIAPTIIDNITWEASVMQEEIFGPILPVLVFEELDEVIKTINIHPKPLALYYFSNDKEKQERVIKEISFGGGCINDTIVHLATPYLPFGGVGNSGMGSYHGKASFDNFSHKKSVLKKSNLIDIPLRYPPYKGKIKLLRKILK